MRKLTAEQTREAFQVLSEFQKLNERMFRIGLYESGQMMGELFRERGGGFELAQIGDPAELKKGPLA